MSELNEMWWRKLGFAGVCLALCSVAFFLKLLSQDNWVGMMKFLAIAFFCANVGEKAIASVTAIIGERIGGSGAGNGTPAV